MEFEVNTTASQDFESLHKSTALSLENKHTNNQALQKRLKDLMGWDTKDTSSVPETRNNYEIDYQDQATNPEDCKSKGIQIKLRAWQDMENANKLLLQEKEAWEAERKKLDWEIIILTKEKYEAEEKQKQALRDREDLQKEKDTITKEAKMNCRTWEEEIAILTKQKCQVEDKEKEAIKINKALQREVQEYQTLLQKEKQFSEARVRAHTREDALRAALEEAEEVHSFDELLIEKLQEEVNVLRERIRVFGKWQQSEDGLSFREVQDMGSEPDRLSLRRKFVRLFIPGWRRRYRSSDTVEYVEPGEQPREETQRRPTLWERFLKVCNRTTTM
ncbi:uncharacterized protein LOC123985681 isoform X1 [Micropterus dolomieu]|uniref:uncharacterized protein LOC123985681 isoform X1 n=1 Tax=Micropterus dolomieu TaxID=147949 RepID=UPI001E8EE3CA|nr:uncharacterized protein LOC123985681 isoform X1 [Micropterus dolomieu]XP_045929412.1 uncharacterized protein LOC123985681 isoform X1 [Micropterus dolomieu]XP_045929421.1 uncharacterized protein LOC123985681 isoform X1 [Micropterus dolomieu]XP_045929430.1 uncharacterized protein LOC123985681 isoform X1 [Micropterus dolomieu]